MPQATGKQSRAEFNRVPKVMLDFWFIKLMAVTMGEADRKSVV